MRVHHWLVVGVTTLALVASACSGEDGDVASTATQSRSGAAAEKALATSRYVLSVTSVDGIDIGEVSGLAWDADEQLLYAVSDQGKVYHFRIERDGMTLVAMNPVFAAVLVDRVTGEGKPDSAKRFNAEGLSVRDGNNGQRGDSELVVALEEKPPQIARFDPSGVLLGRLPVPPPADDSANYRKKNRGLESVAIHPVHGVITAPEAPLRGHDTGLHTVFAQGQAWSFARYDQDSRLKGIEVLPDGRLLVLERSRPASSKKVQVASLRSVDITGCDAQAVCKVTWMAALPAGPENFEGLTLLDAHHALIVDDNGGAASRRTTFSLIALP